MRRLSFVAATGAVLMVGLVDARQALPFKVVGEVTLPGNPTRLDYQSIDSSRDLLFIAHLGDSAVIVVDLKSRRVISTIASISRVHGVLAVPERGVVYASATGTNEVVVINERTLKIVGRVPGGVYPDGMAFDPHTSRLFVSDERGRTETVIDAGSNRPIATIELGGDVGNSQYDPISRHIFVNVQTLGQLVEIDPSTNAIVRRTGVTATGCAGNHGLLIDAQKNRAFIACEDSATLLSLDLATRRITHTWTVGEEPDVLAYDQDKRRLVVAAESGVVSIFNDRNGAAKMAQGFLAPAAHSVTVDQSTHLIYFPLENVGGLPRLRIVEVTT